MLDKQLQTMLEHSEAMKMSDMMEDFDQQLQEYVGAFQILQTQGNQIIQSDEFTQYEICMEEIQK